MTVTTDVRIDATDVIKELSRISDNAEKIIYKGINDAAFELRSMWLKMLGADIANPVSFTKKVFVDKATEALPEATVFIPPIQSEYLNLIVEGGVRKGGDYATVGSDEILAPVNVRLNKSGNIPEGPKRYLGKVAAGLVKNTFIGTPSGDDASDEQRAVYQRNKKGKMKLLAVFIQTEQYKKTLPLYDAAEKFSDVVVDKISARVDELLR